MNKLLTFLVVFSLPIVAIDLDVESARRAYDRQRSEANSAKSNMDFQSEILQTAISRLRSAEGEENQARGHLRSTQNKLQDLTNAIHRQQRHVNELKSKDERIDADEEEVHGKIEDLEFKREDYTSKVTNLKDRITRLDRRISNLKSQPNSSDWTCTYRDKGHEEHRGGHKATNSDKSTAMTEAETVCLSKHGKCRLTSCKQPDSAEVKNLIRQRDRLKNEKKGVDNQLARVEQDLKRKRRESENLHQAGIRVHNEIRDALARMSRMKTDRDAQVWVVEDASRNLDRKITQVERANDGVTGARGPFLAAQANFEREASEAEQARRYWQRVVANYNAARDEVLARADGAASSDSRREAVDRASGVGTSAGVRSAEQVGRERGSHDGAVRSETEGYLAGRKSAGTILALKTEYQSGFASGKSWANQKARAEKFPRGYNSALAMMLAQAPAMASTVDISDQISEEPGEGGALLEPTEKLVGSKASPSKPLPEVPGPSVPGAFNPSVSVPTVEQTYFNPPCNNVVLPEFGPMCKDRYRSSYNGGYSRSYKRIYVQEFRHSFAQNIEAAYIAAFDVKNPNSFRMGQGKGVIDQGLLDGFAASIEKAKTDQYSAGEMALAQTLQTGYLLVYRSASLVGEVDDGILAPGEKLKLSLVIDNYGMKSSPVKKARLRLTGGNALKDVSVEIRELPSLEGSTRTEFIGVISGVIDTQVSGSDVEISGDLEIEKNGEFVKLGTIRLGETTHFPLELTSIDLSKTPRVNETVSVTFNFKNQTNMAMDPTPLSLGSAPVYVQFPKPELMIPELDAGESVDVEVDMKTLYFVGENTSVAFHATTQPGGQETPIMQSFLKQIKVDRTGSLLLLDRNSKPIENSILSVRAGGTATFGIRYKVNRRTNANMKVEKADQSTDTLRLANGTTVGWWPTGTNHQTHWFNYQVPSNLKGKKEWVMFTLQENGTFIHVLMVYLEIR